MKKTLVAAIAAMFIIPGLLLAHNGHKHKTIMGTVKSISASHIDVTTRDGKEADIPLAKDTMFMRDETMVGSDQVKPGTRVAITLGEDDKTAAHVKIGVVEKKK